MEETKVNAKLLQSEINQILNHALTSSGVRLKSLSPIANEIFGKLASLLQSTADSPPGLGMLSHS